MLCLQIRKAPSLRLFAIVLILTLAGCADAGRFSEPVGKYRTATQQTVVYAKPFIANINKVEREHMLLVALDDGTDLDREFLGPTFSPEGIAARMKMFQLIDLYAARLAMVADAKTGQQLRTSADALGAELAGLGTTIAKITGDDTIKDYAGPITALAGFVADLWQESVREQALRTAITQAAPKVDEVLTLLEKDLREAQNAIMEVALDRAATDLEKFNEARGAARAKLGNAVLASANAYEDLATAPPQEVVATMRRAHQAMVAAAQDPENPETFEAFVSAVEGFSVRASQAYAVAQAFVQARR